MAETIEYEKVEIQVPKKIMDFLREMERITHEKPEEYMAYSIVSSVDADISCGETFVSSPQEMRKHYGLVPVFREILNEELEGETE